MSGYVLSFFSPQLLSYFLFLFWTTDYFWASVIELIRKYYIHISWKEEGRGWKGLGYGTLPCSFTPTFPYFKWGGERAGKESSSATSSRYFTLPQHHNMVEGRCDCFQRASSESREGGDRAKEERGRSVSDPSAFTLLVERDELCLCAAWHSLRGLLLCLLLLLRATRGSHLAKKKNTEIKKKKNEG